MLTERLLEVILAVVYEYIQTGKPVSSRKLSKQYLRGRSPATIRNEMADLEEMDFLAQPHTSAGRLPTAQAFRIYVDTILQRHREPPPQAKQWLQEIRRERSDVEGVLGYISNLITRLTHSCGVVALAPLEQVSLMRVDLVAMGGDRVLAVLVLEGGLVHHKMIRLSCRMSQEELDELGRRINAVAVGRPWQAVKQDLMHYVVTELQEHEHNCRSAIDELDTILKQQSYRFFTSGAGNLLQIPGFRDVEKLQTILSILEEEEALAELVESCTVDGGLSVTIGEENPVDRLQDCSVLLATTSAGGQRAVMGLIGPVRMDYEGSIAVLESIIGGLETLEEQKEGGENNG
ncbi:MAG: heat-inducible transcriptional repressor HrcA [Synergistales bacterium]|nr:heat-inducible transcriptional repressor HrcA [Synergistales bacterium]